jgi:hypothetical protein
VKTHLQVLSAETPGLLAVSDDVDCCVLSYGWEPATCTSNAEGAGTSSSAGDDSASAAGQGSQVALLVPFVRHTSTIPALAYIVAGKQQRKHLLIGTCIPVTYYSCLYQDSAVVGHI